MTTTPQPSIRYDYFSASADYEPSELIEDFAEILRGEPRSRRPVNGYTHAVGIHLSDDPEVVIQFTDGQRPNILADGFPSQRIFEITAGRFPNYGLARGDIAVDFHEADSFEVLHNAMRVLSHERNVRHSIIGDWETPGSPAGRTTESGVRQGRRYRRLYEFAKHHGYGPPTRYEFECKPDSAHKHRYAGLGAVALLQTDGYSVELLRRLGIALERMTIAREQGEKPNAWFAHLIHQYGGKLAELVAAELNGDFAQLGIRIEAEVKQRRFVPPAAAQNSCSTAGLVKRYVAKG